MLVRDCQKVLNVSRRGQAVTRGLLGNLQNGVVGGFQHRAVGRVQPAVVIGAIVLLATRPTDTPERPVLAAFTGISRYDNAAMVQLLPRRLQSANGAKSVVCAVTSGAQVSLLCDGWDLDALVQASGARLAFDGLQTTVVRQNDSTATVRVAG
jgi:hypothetical protein